MFKGEEILSEPTNQDILEELRKLNEKIDKLNERTKEPKGISTPLALIALFLGYAILGPIITMLIMPLFY